MRERVVGRVLEDLGEGRIVEYHFDERLDGAAERDDRLPDVDELARAIADAMAADELARAALEDELYRAVLVADDLSARVVAVERAPDYVIDLLLVGLLLREADAAHLG